MTLQYTTPDSPVTVLTTEMNSLASGAVSAAGPEQSNDQAGEFDPLAQAEIYIAAQGSARASGATVSLYVIGKADGTNYPDTTGVLIENYFVGAVSLDAATTARRLNLKGISLPNSDFKALTKNSTGQAFAASGNTVKFSRYTHEDA